MKKFLVTWNKYSFLILIFFLLVILIDLRLIFFALICMIAPIVIASLGFGRLWCKYLCPRGSLYEKIHTKKRHIPIFFKSLYLKIVVLFLIFYMFGMGIYKHYGDIFSIGKVYYNIIFITTVVGISLGLLFHPRTWCVFCPMGSIADFITYIKKRKKDSAKNG